MYVTPSNGAKSKIVITGAIGDYGTATSVDQNGKVDQNGNFVVITLKKGTFKVDSTALNQAANNVQPTVNTTTCSATGDRFRVSDPYGWVWSLCRNFGDAQHHGDLRFCWASLQERLKKGAMQLG